MLPMALAVPGPGRPVERPRTAAAARCTAQNGTWWASDWLPRRAFLYSLDQFHASFAGKLPKNAEFPPIYARPAYHA